MSIGNDLKNWPRLRAAGRPAVRGAEPDYGAAFGRRPQCVLALCLTMDLIGASRQVERVFSAGHAM